MEVKLPWVRWGEYMMTWVGETRDLVVVGQDEPGPLNPGAEVYELPPGADARAVAKEAGGVVVTVFDKPERFGPLWGGG